MSLSALQNIDHFRRQSRLRQGLGAPATDDFLPWPLVDTLFDFTR